MRRERQDHPIPLETKIEARMMQVGICEEMAMRNCFAKIPNEALLSYQQLISTTQLESKNNEKQKIELASRSASVLEYALDAGYVQKVFGVLRIHIALNESVSSFSLHDIKGSSEGSSWESNSTFLDLFQHSNKALEVVQNWTTHQASQLVLSALEKPIKPVLPNLRRDMAARTGELMDFEGYIGGAWLGQKTKIHGVTVMHEYEDNESEFPDVRLIVKRLS